MEHFDLCSGETPLAKQEPVLRDTEQILAYLEQLLRLRSPVSLRLSQDAAMVYECRVELVNEEAGTFTLSLQNRPPQEPKPGTPTYLCFALDGLRFRATARFIRRGG